MKLSKIRSVTVLLLTLLVLFIAVSSASAATTFSKGKEAFDRGDFPVAYRIFTDLLASNPGDAEADFLLGRSAYEIGDFETAIFAFERVLMSHPESDRARLELARVHFAVGDFEAARKGFEVVLANNPPAAVQQNIQVFLTRIDRATRRHTFGGMFSLAFSLDDNVYASPADERINTLLGQVTLTGATAKPLRDHIWQPTLLLNHTYRSRPKAMAWQTTAVTQHAFYEREQELDYNLVGLSSGPLWQSSSLQLSLPVSFNYLSLDSRRYLTTAGIGAELIWLAGSKVNLGVNLQASRLNYANDDRDAWQYRFELRPVGTWGSNRFSAGLGLELNDAREDWAGYLRYIVSVGYERPLFWGITGSCGYRLKRTGYDGKEPLFDRTRKDTLHEFSAGLTRPLWQATDGRSRVLAQLQHVYTDAEANVDLYDYEKNLTTLALSLSF